MSVFLVNASNLKAGGGIQVADSICGLLNEFHEHIFFVVLSSRMECTKNRILPSLLECFSATYPEAMKMEVPIITTDLDFSKGLCGDAACYYSAIDPVAAADAIYRVATDKSYANQLVENGKRVLLTYDNYKQRAEKLIGILEEISINK